MKKISHNLVVLLHYSNIWKLERYLVCKVSNKHTHCFFSSLKWYYHYSKSAFTFVICTISRCNIDPLNKMATFLYECTISVRLIVGIIHLWQVYEARIKMQLQTVDSHFFVHKTYFLWGYNVNKCLICHALVVPIPSIYSPVISRCNIVSGSKTRMTFCVISWRKD